MQKTAYEVSLGLVGSGAKVIPSYYDNKTFYLGKVPLGLTSVITLVVTVLSMLVLTFLVQKTKLGKAMRAVSEDMDAARLMGINVNANIMLTVGLSAAICSIIGLLSIPILNVKLTIALKGFSAGIVGGFGSIPGAIVGGLLIGIVESLYTGVGPSVYRDVVAFVLLIGFLLVKPEGILKKKTVNR